MVMIIIVMVDNCQNLVTGFVSLTVNVQVIFACICFVTRKPANSHVLCMSLTPADLKL